MKVRLLRDGQVIARTVRTITAEDALTIALPTSPKARRALRRGAYTIEVTPGRRSGDYGITTARTVRVR